MNTTSCVCDEVEEFPAKAKEFLAAFYSARNVQLDNTIGKIEVLRQGYELNDAIIAADESVSNDEEELKILEFYVLTKSGII